MEQHGTGKAECEQHVLSLGPPPSQHAAALSKTLQLSHYTVLSSPLLSSPLLSSPLVQFYDRFISLSLSHTHSLSLSRFTASPRTLSSPPLSRVLARSFSLPRAHTLISCGPVIWAHN